MNVLEKILKGIDKRKDYREGLVKYEERVGTITDVIRNKGAIEELGIIKKIIRSHMDEAENDGWIPVEERVPEETTGRYYPKMIVTTSYGAVTWGFYRVMDKQWYIYSNIHNEFVKAGDKEIVAWKPLPEPYKPKKDITASGKEHIMSRFMTVE